MKLWGLKRIFVILFRTLVIQSVNADQTIKISTPDGTIQLDLIRHTDGSKSIFQKKKKTNN